MFNGRVDENPANWGRFVLEDGTVINFADMFKDVYQFRGFTVGSAPDREFMLGNAYGVGNIWLNVANDAYVVMHVKTSVNPVFITYSVNTVALTEYGMYELPVLTGDGTELDFALRNHLSTQLPTMHVFKDPTYSSLGSLIIPRFIGSGVNPTSRTGGERFAQTLIIKPNTSYLIVARNASGAAQSHLGIYADWNEIYEPFYE